MILLKNQFHRIALLSSVKLCIAIAMIGLSLGLIHVNKNTPPSERIYWVGLLLSASGVIGIVTAIQKSRIAIGLYLLMCSIGCMVSVIGGVMVGLAATSVVNMDKRCIYKNTDCLCRLDGDWIIEPPGTCNMLTVMKNILCSLTVLSAISFVISLIGSMVAFIGLREPPPTLRADIVVARTERNRNEADNEEVLMQSSEPHPSNETDHELLIS
ncbi:uncharacterized protein [Ptychodera flava]|uniref:uncharacterized protein isoform X1 n=1 Tax=Ptychodera flava TaxID=63121 RepID=UPI00396A26B6